MAGPVGSTRRHRPAAWTVAALMAAGVACLVWAGSASAPPPSSGHGRQVTLRVSPSRIEALGIDAGGCRVRWSGRVTVSNPSSVGCMVVVTTSGLAHSPEGLPEARTGSVAPPTSMSVSPDRFVLAPGQARHVTVTVERRFPAAYVCLAFSAGVPGGSCEVGVLVPVVIRAASARTVGSGDPAPDGRRGVRLTGLYAARSPLDARRLELKCEAFNAGTIDVRVRVRFTVALTGTSAAAAVTTREVLILPGCSRAVAATVEEGVYARANAALGKITLCADVLAGSRVLASKETPLSVALAVRGSQG